MQWKYILYWQNTMQNFIKFEFFNTFKNDYTPSSYLRLTSKLSERKELVKFRIGNHNRLRLVDMIKFQGLTSSPSYLGINKVHYFLTLRVLNTSSVLNRTQRYCLWFC